jgi:hypothetical protein
MILDECTSARLLNALADKFRQILDRQRAVIEDGFVIAAQVELVSQFALDLLSQSVKSSTTHKIR